MTDNKDLEISAEAYDRYMRIFKIIRERIGLNIKVHSEDQAFSDGQIFLFNHFARFETAIPPYMIHSRTGAYCRSIAYHGLFKVNDRLTNILKKMGAVPNNTPNLLPFLAAEILRGRKVVVFPEGGLIKDRKITDDKGRLRIFSQGRQEFIKLHRGAAVLAMTLDLFKRRIQYLFETEDIKRLEHWRLALDLPSLDELKKKAYKPTNIVPSTITFYPMRIDENVLNKGLDLFAKGIPKSFAEEVSIEGNIILKDTDMDIRLGDPIVPNKSWQWWEVFLLKKYFLNIESLDDLFSLKDKEQPTLLEKTLIKCIGKGIDNVRDRYMEGLYAGTTVNLSHLASTLITKLFAQGTTEIEKEEFHELLYLALKELQNSGGAHLHRSLNAPERYRKLVMGENFEFERFLNMCAETELMTLEGDVYKISDKLEDDWQAHEVRIENPLSVYANEVAPIDAVQKAIDKALKNLKEPNPEGLSRQLFEDEVLAYHWAKTHFSEERFDEINNKETFTQSGKPYLLLPKKKAKKGILLVHGFLASPAELKDFAEKLHEKGYAVMGVRLAGHGTSPWDLQDREWDDWIGSVRRGYLILEPFADEIVTIGFSTGGALGLLHSAEAPDKLVGVASICAPLAIQGKGIMLIPWMNRLNKVTRPFSSGHGLVPFYEKQKEDSDINYKNSPVSTINEFRNLMKALKNKLPEVALPTLIVQATKDSIVEPESARKIFDGIKSKDKELHMVESDKHGLIMHNVGETHDLLLSFVEQLGSRDE